MTTRTNSRKLYEDRATWFEDLAGRLSAPFPGALVAWIPLRTWDSQDWKNKDRKTHDRALLAPYIDSRHVMDLLDREAGPGAWQFELAGVNSAVAGRLGILDPFCGAWVWKSDIGHRGGDRDDRGEKTKGQASDALKRAAVHWGVFRYAYRHPKVKVVWDPKYGGRPVGGWPTLQAWALPGGDGFPPPGLPDTLDLTKGGRAGAAGNGRPSPTSGDPGDPTDSLIAEDRAHEAEAAAQADPVTGEIQIPDFSGIASPQAFWPAVYKITDAAEIDRDDAQKRARQILEEKGGAYGETLTTIARKIAEKINGGA
jgi:hypothetical protein